VEIDLDLEKELGVSNSENKRLRVALEAIEGGSFPNASTLAIAGDWKAMYEALQTLARNALDR